jgi:hypothetical protein
MMRFQRVGIIIAAAAGMLGTFLPWVNVPILGSFVGTQSDGWITFVLFALTAFLAIVGNKQRVLRGGQFFITMLFGVAAGGFGLWKIIDFHTSIGNTASDNPLTRAVGSVVSIGVGLYLIVIAGLAVLVLGSAFRKE